MKQFYTALCIISILILFSCTSRLNNDSKRFIPYKGYEWLVLKTEQGERDTIILSGYEDYSSTESSGGLKKSVEHYNLTCLFGSQKENNSKKDSKWYLVGLTARGNEKTIVSFNLNDRRRNYYYWNAVNVDSLYKLRKEELQIGANVINDIVAIRNRELEKSNPDSSAATNISMIYWSITKGIIGYTLVNGTKWELEKIIPG